MTGRLFASGVLLASAGSALTHFTETKGTTMKTLLALLGLILLTAPLAATAQQFGDFTYSSDGTAITITGYTGAGGAVIIPDAISGLPVTRLGIQAFFVSSLTSVTIPGSVTEIG